MPFAEETAENMKPCGMNAASAARFLRGRAFIRFARSEFSRA